MLSNVIPAADFDFEFDFFSPLNMVPNFKEFFNNSENW